MSGPVEDHGGWISGPMAAKDDRPEYSPRTLLLDIVAVLGRAGIDVDLTPAQENAAIIACTRVLRTVGVRPTTPPR